MRSLEMKYWPKKICARLTIPPNRCIIHRPARMPSSIYSSFIYRPINPAKHSL
ncbi:hypothetical protein D3C72_1075530 [compost metagenome]